MVQSECCPCQKTIIQNRISKLFQFFPFLVLKGLHFLKCPLPLTHLLSSHPPLLLQLSKTIQEKSPPPEDSLLSSLLSLPFSLNSGLQRSKELSSKTRPLLKPDKEAEQAKPECLFRRNKTNRSFVSNVLPMCVCVKVAPVVSYSL